MNKITKLLELIAFLDNENETKPTVSGESSQITNRYLHQDVIVRSYSAGNHFGVLDIYDAKNGIVVLKNARRIWKWNTDKGISLSEIATYGIVQGNSKICTMLPEQIIAEVDEILPCSETAAQSLRSAEVYKP